MTDTDRPTDPNRFEDRLLQELLTELPPAADPGPARPPGRRRALLAGAGGLTAAVAALLAGTLVGNTGHPAYAIESEPDGRLAVVLYSITAADVAKAEADLQQRGVRIELVADPACLDVLTAPRLPSPPHPLPSGPPSVRDYPEFHAFAPVTGNPGDRRNPITGEPLGPQERAFTVRPDLIPAGEVLWVALAGAEAEGATLVKVSGFAPVGAPQPNLCG
ncbi:hypothetical protein [Micromonospora cathayae]|uniref:Uncharacterized protein n=1 Tax=Micromonospora cathayae TaxID=3028804 RepID=A0ABY7ZQB7_9ACTN|nr:hypothetical protein [Micromonospora sp. HUAS 3]WDZ85205.1 hypothetical protein PVK37_01695 [Micromonospora sp. HUAS 3]